MNSVPLSARISLALVVAVVLAAPLAGATFEPMWPLILGAVCAVSAIFAVVSPLPTEHPMRTLPSLAVALAVAAAFLSIFVSVNKGASVEAFALAAALAALWHAVSTAPPRLRDRFLVAAVAVAASGVALWGIREYLLNWAVYGEAGRQWRIFSTFINPNMLAGYLTLTAPLTLGIVITGRAKALVWASAVGFWAQLGALALTGSRFGTLSGLGAIALFTAAWFAVRRKGPIRARRAGVVAVVGLAVLAASSGPLLRRETAAQAVTTPAVQGAASAAQDEGGSALSKIRDPFREHVWASTARMWLEHPVLGTGIGTFEYIYPAYATVGYTAAAHNGYLQALSEMGSPWVAIFILWIVALARAGVRALRLGGDSGVLRLAALAGLAGSGLHSLYDYDWQTWAIAATACPVLIIALGSRDEEASGAQAPRGQTRGLRFALLAAALVLAALSASLAASHSYARVARSEDQSSEHRIGAYRAATRLNPFNAEFKRELGSFLVELSWHEDDPALARDGFALMRKACEQAPTDAVGWYQLGRALDDAQMDEAYLHQLWTTTTETVKRIIVLPSLWHAMEAAIPVTIEEDNLVLVLPPGEFSRAGLLTASDHRNVIEKILEENFGRRLSLEVIERTTLEPWMLEDWMTNEAIQAFRRAVEYSKVGTPALIALADIYLYSGDLERAREFFARVVEIQKGPVGRYPAVAGSVNPDYIAGLVGLGELDLLGGRYDTSAARNIDGLKVFRAHQLWMLGLGGGLLALEPGSQEELDAFLSAGHAASSLAEIYDEKGKKDRGEVWSDCTDILGAFAEAENASLEGSQESAQDALRYVVESAESTRFGDPLARSIAYRAAARALQKLALDATPDERDLLVEKGKEFERLAREADALIE